MTDLRAALEEIRHKHGRLTPQLVVDEWRDEAHPFHSRLPWDDTLAAEAWRRQCAHELIQSVRVVYRRDDESTSSVRAYHAVRRDDSHVYEPVEEIVSDPLTLRLVLSDMEREWRTLKARYDKFREFWDLVRADTQKAG